MPAPKKIAVVGATGRVGKQTVGILTERGYDVVEISRSQGVDVVTGEGLATALVGVDVIVDAASNPTPDQAEATGFFTASAENLQREGARAGVRQIVVVSIIGIDNFAGGYYAAKIEQERVHRAGPVPIKILRAAQCHEFLGIFIEWCTQGDVAYLPKMRTQPVAARAVAEVLADLAVDEQPLDKPWVEIAGPQAETLADVAAALAAKRGYPAKIEEVSADDPDQRLAATGALLPSAGAILAGPTYAEWLETQFASR
ncbi:MAG: SDR family oxidoreductase [Vicinamibacteraceae bacterium]